MDAPSAGTPAADRAATGLEPPRPVCYGGRVITFDAVSKRYGERLALDFVSWHMDEGECVVVVGPSAAGKTSLLKLITHELQPTSGTITVGTFKGGRLRRRHRALLRRTLGIVYEDFRLLADRTVFDNVALAVNITGRFSDEEVIPRVMYALEEVGLPLKQGALPTELSYGERQRVAIARAIVNRPAVVLADEPTGALEQKSADDILRLLRRIHDEGAALLVTSTRMEVAEKIGGRLLRLEDGKLLDANGRPVTGAPQPRRTGAASGGADAVAEAPITTIAGTPGRPSEPFTGPTPHADAPSRPPGTSASGAVAEGA